MLCAMVDMQFPDTPGERPPGFDQSLQYMKALDGLLADDVELHTTYAEVMQLTAPISVLFEESVQAKVAAYLAKSDAA